MFQNDNEKIKKKILFQIITSKGLNLRIKTNETGCEVIEICTVLLIFLDSPQVK